MSQVGRNDECILSIFGETFLLLLFRDYFGCCSSRENIPREREKYLFPTAFSSVVAGMVV